MLTRAEQASALGWASVARRWLGDLDGSAATAERARSAAAVAGDHLTTAIARAALDPDRRVSEELGLGWHLPSYQMVRAAER